MKSTQMITGFILSSAILLSFAFQCAAADFRYCSILAETMRPIDSSIEYDCFSGVLKTTQNSQLNFSTSYIAQVDLPEGARIDTATCFGYDTASMENFGFGLYRYRFNGMGNPVFEDITNIVSSSGTSGYVELAASLVDPVDPPGLPVINNENYSYGLYLELPKATDGELYVVRCVVRASIEGTSHFRQIEIK